MVVQDLAVVLLAHRGAALLTDAADRSDEDRIGR